jgi:hypothetical protein
METAPGLDGCADDEELRAALGRDARHVLPEASRPRADDFSPHTDAVRGSYGGRALEPLLEGREPAIHVRVQRQLALDDERRDENDLGPAVSREAAGEIERVLRLVPVEHRHDDAPVGDRARPAREAPSPAVEQLDVRQLHRRRW